MACPCCVRYCHAPSPCAKDIRIKVTWGPVVVVSSLVQPAGLGGGCGDFSGGFSGTGSAEVLVGTCFDTGSNPPRPVTARIQIGWSQNAQGRYANPSCCYRTGQRTARIGNGRIGCFINNGPAYNYARQPIYDFSFATLDAQADVTFFAANNVGDTTPCGEALIADFVNAPPTVELVVVGNPPDFCDPSQVVGGFPAVSGPYGSLDLCTASCGNPLP